MTSQVHFLDASFELRLDRLHNYFDADPDFPDAVADVELERRNNILVMVGEATDDSISKYTPTAQLKAQITEKRVYDEETVGKHGQPRWADPDDKPTGELVEFACFKGDLEDIIQNTALQYPMFSLLCNIANIDDIEGSLKAVALNDGSLESIMIRDGTPQNAAIDVVCTDCEGEAAEANGGVDWTQNEYL